MLIMSSLRKLTYRIYQDLANMKTPQACFEEARAAINADFDQALRFHHCAADSAERTKHRNDILGYGPKLEELSRDHLAKVDQKNKEYQRQRQQKIEAFCRDLIHTVGEGLFERLMQELRKSSSDEVSPTPTEKSTPPAAEPEVGPEADVGDSPGSLLPV